MQNLPPGNAQDKERQLTLLSEDSLASLSVLPGSEEARKMTVTSGLKCLELLANSDPPLWLAKMFLASSRYSSTKRFLTWKVKGTQQSNLLFRLVPSMPRTKENDSLLWPTATKADTFTGNLESSQQKEGSIHSVNLSQAVNNQLWATPNTMDGLPPKSPEALHKEATEARPGRSQPANLRDQVSNASLWATPQSQGRKVSLNTKIGLVAQTGGRLNPMWVEWLMGFPTKWTELEPSETQSSPK